MLHSFQHRLAKSPAPVRLGVFILILLLLWLPFAAPIYLLVDNSNSASIGAMGLLYLEFMLLVWVWGRTVHRQPRIFQHYGLEISRRNGWELVQGFGLGWLVLCIVFGIEFSLGWVTWHTPGLPWQRLIQEALMVGLGVGFAEELLFRGWLYDELQRDYPLRTVLWGTAIPFALLHFIKPLETIVRTFPQFLGLLLLGLTLVWAKRSQRGRLGLPIGLHAGLISAYYCFNVGQVMQYSHRVPDWVTGIDGNPLAGLMGLAGLGSIALSIALWTRFSHSRTV